MWKRIKLYTASTIILGLGGACVYLYYFGRREAVVRRVLDPPAVVKEEKVPFGSEQVLLMVQADVLGGAESVRFESPAEGSTTGR